MLAHGAVVDRFFQGKKSGKGARMEIIPIDEETTVLEGYGWAAYAINHKGKIYKFGGWIGFSVTTTQHMMMINPPENIDYYAYYSPSTSADLSRFFDVPEDKYERLESEILKPTDRFEFPDMNLVIRPTAADLVVKDTETEWYTHIPEYEKAAKAILENDQKSLEFMKRLANSTLDPRNHMHFSLPRLEEAIGISERVREANTKYSDVIKQKNIGREVFTPLNIDGCMLFARKTGGEVKVLAVYNTLYDIACFSGSIPKVVLGKALYNKKIHKTMKEKIFKDKNQITPSEFANEIAKHGLSDTIKGLPDWISTEVIAHQLGVA